MMKYRVVFKTEYCGVENIVVFADDFFSAVEVAKMALKQDKALVSVLAIKQMFILAPLPLDRWKSLRH